LTVLDSSFFIEEKEPPNDAVTLPEVRDELRDSTAFRFDALVGSGMRLETPSDEAVAEARWAARETGDEDVLSNVDLRLIALAHDLGTTLVTDDYAMQNVASHLGVETRGAGKDEIDEERDWRFQCVGCGRVYEDDRRCEVCGSETTRKNPS